MNFIENYLEKMLPRFKKKPAKKSRSHARLARDGKANNDLASKPAGLVGPLAHDPAGIEGPEMLDQIVFWLRRYLVCDDHQLTILALWIVHTWCYPCFSTTAYLNIRSPESESGKSLCLDLLGLSCAHPCRINGADSRTIFHKLLTERNVEEDQDFDYSPCAFLLDDCHHTFGSSERQPLIALLNSGSRRCCRYTLGNDEFTLFAPKVFAGHSRLPRSLAARCIPILLRRKRPSEAVSRLQLQAPDAEAIKLPRQLGQWCDENSETLKQAAHNAPDKLPPYLTARQRDCAEPLLHIADRIGGFWPERARTAIVALFNLGDSSLAIDLLADIRLAFAFKENPEYLTTADIASILASLDFRSWSLWSRSAGRKFGGLLHPFGIKSRNLRLPDDNVLKGYLFKDFQDAWERYLPPLTGCSATKTAPATASAT